MRLGVFQKKFQIIVIVVLLAGALAVSVFAGSRASKFFNFAKASTCEVQNVKTVQVTSNSAVVSWETADASIGKVVYGADELHMSLSSLEKTTDKIHNVPLTLLTPNTQYKYVITIGQATCDSTGQTCSLESGKGKACMPWAFTTAPVVAQGEIVAPLLTATPYLSPTATIVSSPSATPKATGSAALVPTSTLSDYCSEVKKNIGSTQNSANWTSVKKYDVDGNGTINGMDVIKCPTPTPGK